MRTVVLSLVLALCACAGYSQTDARTKVLDTKPGLDTKVTLTMRAASLREVLDKVEAETKVRLRPDRDIAEDKVTLRVKDMPARDLLRAVAKCCDLGWAEAEIGDLRYLNLYMDRESRRAMDQRLYDDYAAILDQFDTEMKATVAALRSKAEVVIPATGSVPNDEIYRAQWRSTYASNEQLGSMPVQYLSLTDPQKKALFEGKEITVDRDLVCKEALELYPGATKYTFWVERSLAGYLLQGSVQPMMPEHEWSLITMALFDDRRYDKIIQTVCDELAKDEALAKEITLPKPIVPTTLSGEAIPPGESVQIIVPKPGAGSGATPTTMSDALLSIVETADLQFISQYLSEYGPVNSSTPQSGKISDLLAAQCKLHKFTIAKEGNLLQGRSLLWHRLHDREVPEKTIKRWQALTTGVPYPPFQVFVEMGSCTWGQLRGIIGNYRCWFGSTEPPGLAAAEYACKLYSSLSATQQRALWEGASIPVTALRPEQQHIFMQAFETKARPTYVKAQDPSWRSAASMKLNASDGQGGHVLYAIADTRLVGTQPIEVETTSVTNEQGNVLFAHAIRISPEAVAKALGELLARIATEHPEIPRKKIAVYRMELARMQFAIGEDNSSATIFHCEPVD